MKTINNREAAEWFQVDAEYLYRMARTYREAGKDWIAIKVQNNAAYSAEQARQYAALAA
jgi:hypothetical protein